MLKMQNLTLLENKELWNIRVETGRLRSPGDGQVDFKTVSYLNTTLKGWAVMEWNVV
jgi:hypothetical protein